MGLTVHGEPTIPSGSLVPGSSQTGTGGSFNRNSPGKKGGKVNQAAIQSGKAGTAFIGLQPAQTLDEQAAADRANQLKAAQATVRQLNESAARTGSSRTFQLREVNGQIQVVPVVRQTQQSRTVAQNGGPQQLAPLSSQIAPAASREVPIASSVNGGVITQNQQTGQITQPSKPLQPVATSVSGETLFVDSQTGKIFEPVASDISGGFQAQEVRSNPKLSAQVLPSSKGEGFLTPNVFLGPSQRQDIIKAGEFLVSAGSQRLQYPGGFPESRYANELIGVEQTAAKVLGGNLEALGYNPKEYVAFNVVLPLEGGAALSAGGEVISKTTPRVAEALGASALNAGRVGAAVDLSLVGAGAFGAGAEVVSRSAVAQRPDVLFGLLGASAAGEPLVGKVEFTSKVNELSAKGFDFVRNAAEPSKIIDVVPEGEKSVGGLNKVGAVRNAVGERVSPTSKAQLRKQSLNQAYDPNLYRNAGEFGVKSGKSREYIRLLEKNKVDIGSRRPATELGVAGQSYETGVKFDFNPGGKAEAYSSYGFTEGAKLGTRAGQGKIAKYANRDVSQLGYQDTVVALQKSGITKAVEVFSGPKRSPVELQAKFVEPGASVLKSVPEYELKPNSNPAQYSKYASQPSHVNAQGRGRVYEELVQRAKSKGTGFVLMDSGVQNLPAVSAGRGVIDVSPGEKFDVSVLNAKSNDLLAAPGSVVSSVVGSRSGVSSKSVPIVAFSPSVKQENNLKLDLKVNPKVSSGSRLSSRSAQNAVQSPVFDQAQALKPVQASDLAQEQRTNQKQSFAPAFPSPRPVPSNRVIDVSVTPVKPVFDFGGPKEKRPRVVKQEVPTRENSFARFPGSSSRKGGAEFLVQVGAKGNKYFFNLGAGGPDLIEKARGLAKNTAAASVRVVPLSSNNNVDVQSILGSDFQRNKKGVYVQTTKTRISSSGEKAQIPGASRSSRLSKGSSYGKTLSKINKGFSLRSIRRGL